MRPLFPDAKLSDCSAPLICSFWKWPHRQLYKLIGAERCPYTSPLHERFRVGCSLPLIRLGEHFTAIRASCKRCLPGRWKPDMLRPGIVGVRRAILYNMVIPLRPWVNVEYIACETRFSSRELDNQRSVTNDTLVYGQTGIGGRHGWRWAMWKTLTPCKEDAAYIIRPLEGIP